MSKLKYRCPQCGKKVVFSEHFCSAGPEDFQKPKTSPAGKGLFKKLGTLLIVAFLAGALLWPFLDWRSTLVVGLIIIAGAGIILFAGSRRQSSSGPLYRNLVTMVGSDRNAAERMIDAELSKYPDFSRSECIRRVHDRLEYEHRR